MRFVKLVLFLALVAAWWQLWPARDQVISAYTEDRPPLALELDGVGAVLADDERPASPFALTPAGLGRAPTFLPIARTNEDDSEPEPIPVTGGDASLSGIVTLRDGTPVSGATVRIERFTSDGQGVAETVSGPDGSWSADGLLGGRVRVRAFAPGQLASVDPSVLVLSQTGTANVALVADIATPGVRIEMIGPPGIAIGTADTVAIVVSQEQVDDSGRLIQLPVVGRIMSASISGARLLSADAVTTDIGGAARFLVACDSSSSPVATLADGDDRSVVTLPLCLTAEALAEIEAAAAAERAAEQDANQLVSGPVR